MMRSPHYYSVACRAPNGEIVVDTVPVEKTWIGRQKWLRLPFLRGSFAILDSMMLGHKAMNFAGNVQVEDKYQKVDPEAVAVEKKEEKPKTRSMEFFESIAVPLAMVVGLGLGLLIFDYVPQLVAQVIGTKSLKDQGGTLTNYVAEVVKIIIFIGYLALIARVAAIKELFKYHGAEHKAINALELAPEVTVETSRAQSRLHPRCGTSFMVIVLVVGFLFMPLVPRYPLTGKPGHILMDASFRFLIVLMLLPIVAGISYELLKIAGKFRNEKWVNYAFAPGLLSQKVLTTVEPETPHLEVAVASLHAVMKAEKTGELTKTDPDLK